VKHNVFVGMFDSKSGKIGNDGDSFDAPFCKMNESDKDRLNR